MRWMVRDGVEQYETVSNGMGWVGDGMKWFELIWEGMGWDGMGW